MNPQCHCSSLLLMEKAPLKAPRARIRREAELHLNHPQVKLCWRSHATIVHHTFHFKGTHLGCECDCVRHYHSLQGERNKRLVVVVVLSLTQIIAHVVAVTVTTSRWHDRKMSTTEKKSSSFSTLCDTPTLCYQSGSEASFTNIVNQLTGSDISVTTH